MGADRSALQKSCLPETCSEDASGWAGHLKSERDSGKMVRVMVTV